MSLHRLLKKINKDREAQYFGLFRKLFLSITIILVAILSFGIGRLSVIGDREPVKIEYDSEIYNFQFPSLKQPSNQAASVIQAISGQEVVVSKNGSKYHYSHCPGAKQIKEENKIVFQRATAAEAAGYTLAANCKLR